MSRSRPGTRPGTNTSTRSRAPSTGGPRPPSSPSNTSTSPTPKSSGSPLTEAQKNKLIEEAIMEEEENGPGKHRIGAVYADPEVRRMLANGQGPTRHAELLKSKYLDLIDQRNQRRQKGKLCFRKYCFRLYHQIIYTRQNLTYITCFMNSYSCFFFLKSHSTKISSKCWTSTWTRFKCSSKKSRKTSIQW